MGRQAWEFRLRSLLAALVLISLLWSVPRSMATARQARPEPAVRPATPVNLRLAPASTLATVNQVILFTVWADAGTQPVDGIDVQLLFDPNQLTVSDSTGRPDTTLTTGSALPVTIYQSVNNATGDVRVGVGSSIGGQPASGTFSVLSLYLKVKGPTSAAIVRFGPLSDVVINSLSVLGDLFPARMRTAGATIPCRLTGDFDCSCEVHANDIQSAAGAFAVPFGSPRYVSKLDVDNNAVIDLDDVQLAALNWLAYDPDCD